MWSHVFHLVPSDIDNMTFEEISIYRAAVAAWKKEANKPMK